MEQQTKSSKTYFIALVALILGVVFDYLFFRKFIGISVLIFVTLIVISALVFATWFKVAKRQSLWLIACVLFFSAMVAIRANMLLTVLNILATIGLLLLVARVLAKEKLFDFTIRKYISTVFVIPFAMIWKSLRTLSSLVTPIKLNSTVKWRPVAKGIMMALPLLIIFVVLFSAADMGFKNFLTSIFKWHIPADVFSHTGIIGGLFIICLGFFSFIFIVLPGKESEWKTGKENEADKNKPDRRIETQVFLWLINALFLIFIVFQIAYLFGGAINIGEFTYAEYARRGFWELLTVTGITLIILLIMDFYTRNGQKRKYWFTLPSLVMTAEIFIIVASALKRMMLYQSTYGWTTLRLYVAGFIIFLAVIFFVLIIKLILEKKNNFFALGTLLAIIAFLVVFNFLNPDQFIVHQNIQRFNETGKIDSVYMTYMSADGIVGTLGIYDRLDEESKKMLISAMVGKKFELEKQTKKWQSYNYSRERALRSISDFLSKFPPDTLKQF